MNNPFRNNSRPQNDFGQSRSDWSTSEARYDGDSRRQDEGRSWRSDDSAYDQSSRYAQDRSGQGYGQYERGNYDTGSGDHHRAEAGPRGYGYGRYERGGQSGDYSQQSGGRDWTGGYGASNQRAFGAQDSRDYRQADYYGAGHSGYGRGQTYDNPRYSGEGYAPGAQIWNQSDQGRGQSHHDFEPDYLHWREQQMSKFDSDYRDWRSEKREKFSSDFDSWRENRAANPIVGDVTDGGVGSQKDLKKS